MNRSLFLSLRRRLGVVLVPLATVFLAVPACAEPRSTMGGNASSHVSDDPIPVLRPNLTRTKAVRLFEIPPPGEDLLAFTVWDTIEVPGRGTDVLEATGTFRILRKEASCKEWGDGGRMEIEIVDMELQGTSKLLGDVTVHLRRDPESRHGTYGYVLFPDDPCSPAGCEIDAAIEFTLEDSGVTLFNKKTVPLTSMITRIPPIGQGPRSPEEGMRIPLYDVKDPKGPPVAHLLDVRTEVGPYVHEPTPWETDVRRTDAVHLFEIPPPGEDHLAFTVWDTIEVPGHGIQVLEATGDFRIKRKEASCKKWGDRGRMEIEIVDMELRGTNEVLGDVAVRLRRDPKSSTYGSVIWSSGPYECAKCFVDALMEFELSGQFETAGFRVAGLPRDGVTLFNREPVPMIHMITHIPPIGQGPRSPEGGMRVPLYNVKNPKGPPVAYLLDVRTEIGPYLQKISSGGR